MKELYFSGIQPTGNLHLGNYICAIKPWVELQAKKDCIFCIADLHSITIPQDPKTLHNAILNTYAMYIAAGIDIEKNIVFIQSLVKEHTELTWFLSCATPIGWMNRMTQYKDKIAKNASNATLGLFSYPVLMAADILLYKATHVPVGNDQKQHVEITRDIAQLVNNKLNEDFFPLPEPVIPSIGARIMSLRDGTKKMSKSDESDFSRINLTDTDDLIASKIKKAKTDSFPIPDNLKDLESRPEAMNLISILSAVTNNSIENILNQYKNLSFSSFKKDLSDALIKVISPIRDKYNEISNDKEFLKRAAFESSIKASEIAKININKLKEKYGFIV